MELSDGCCTVLPCNSVRGIFGRRLHYFSTSSTAWICSSGAKQDLPAWQCKVPSPESVSMSASMSSCPNHFFLKLVTPVGSAKRYTSNLCSRKSLTAHTAQVFSSWHCLFYTMFCPIVARTGHWLRLKKTAIIDLSCHHDIGSKPCCCNLKKTCLRYSLNPPCSMPQCLAKLSMPMKPLWHNWHRIGGVAIALLEKPWSSMSLASDSAACRELFSSFIFEKGDECIASFACHVDASTGTKCGIENNTVFHRENFGRGTFCCKKWHSKHMTAIAVGGQHSCCSNNT